MNYLAKEFKKNFKQKLSDTNSKLQREILFESETDYIDEFIENKFKTKLSDPDKVLCQNSYKLLIEGDNSIKKEDCCSCHNEISDKIEMKNWLSEYQIDIESRHQSSYNIKSPKGIPIELTIPLQNFHNDYPESIPTAFIMMQFTSGIFHKEIVSAIKIALSQYGIHGLRADDKEYSDDLFANVRTYMHGCDFGIAVFDRIQENDINPNVSLEVGYMMGMDKKVCLLKEQTLNSLQSDLTGKLYKQFNLEDLENTIKRELSKWIKDKITTL